MDARAGLNCEFMIDFNSSREIEISSNVRVKFKAQMLIFPKSRSINKSSQCIAHFTVPLDLLDSSDQQLS